jgi:4-cresol dehydrogenase (hydroxylating)
MPAPQYFQAFFFKTADPEGVGAIVDALRPLRLDQTLRSVVHVGNDFKVLTATSHRPFDGSGAPVNLTPDTMSAIRAKLGIGSWNGSGGLYGTKAQVREARRRVRRALRGKVDRLQFVDDRFLSLLRTLAGPLTLVTRWDVSHTIGVLESVYGLMKGKPTRSTLASVYWPKKNVPIAPSDPDRDACGLLWCSPVVPNTGADVSRASAIATNALRHFGFEPQISVSLASERTAVCVVSISYDRAQEGADARAAECYRALTQLLIDEGYPPYRLNVNSTTAFETSAEYSDVLRSLKEALDPHGVLSPGRYTPITPRRVGHQEGVA